MNLSVYEFLVLAGKGFSTGFIIGLVTLAVRFATRGTVNLVRGLGPSV